MKAKLMALVLAAGLGVTGIAMTAQAATGCSHSTLIWESEENVTYTNSSGLFHTVESDVTYCCKYCPYEVTIHETRIEDHNFEYRDGWWYCVCGEEEMHP